MHHLYTDEPDGSPVTIHLDVELSRRKRFHVVASAEGGILFRSRLVSDCIRWLDFMAISEYKIDAGGCTVMVNGSRALAQATT